MHQFLPKALNLLKKYKSLLKKKLPHEEYRQALMKLQLDESLPRDDVSAYRSLTFTMEHLKKQSYIKFAKVRFSGTKRFLQDVESLLNWYRLEKNQVVHTSQEASAAMVKAIQLIVLPPEKRTPKIAVQLDQHALKIAQDGVNEQRLVFWHSLRKVSEHDESFFEPLMMRYQEYLERHADSHVLMQLMNAA